ncbi:CAF17-like 4Fe-4S cluster assembly/insertion protein YgfZ [Ideonella paludis]|uniref:CAF17-like 4Fe-4S cluster assembly/insertion protein YgfZ n=1 Tax=Ideonella paludis TaxID=1233411 RepID=UPI003638F37D
MLLPNWGVIRATGDDAADFLHGQLTADIKGLAEGQARLAGFCSAKGRLTASFVVWRSGADLLLACSADLLAPTLKRLSMFVLRAKCKLSDASAELAVFGLLGPVVPTQAPWTVHAAEGGQVVHLPPALGLMRALWVGAGAPPASTPALAADVWAYLEVASGVARITAATVDQFVPQMVNFELVGGVNFKKGCYPGQEVVARSQYRGTLKRRAFLVETSSPCVPGQEIFHSQDPEQPAGMVVLAASLAAGAHLALVELKLAALESGSLSVGNAGVNGLRLQRLPYDIPTESP